MYPTTSPQDEATTELLERLRTETNPALQESTGAKLYVGGTQAITSDFTTVLQDALPLFLAIVVGLGFLALVLLFHSLVVPLTAAITSMLSFAAAMGITVAVFQWGWFMDLLGIPGTGPIFPFLPIMVFAILFGLSMDYQVFLVSRMQEEWVHTRDNKAAVRRGLAGSGRVVVIAAAIMSSVFLAFVPSTNATIKLFGIALASAVIIDAFIVRLVLVPSLMSMLGKANWWLPELARPPAPQDPHRGAGGRAHRRRAGVAGRAAESRRRAGDRRRPLARRHPRAAKVRTPHFGRSRHYGEAHDSTGGRRAPPCRARRALPDRPPRSALVLLALVTGAIVSNINLSIANVALPTIGADLGATQDQLTSIANAFALGLASTVLYLGSIGDRYGRKLLFVLGCVLTVPTAMLAAWAPSPEVLTLARFAGGFAAALLFPTTLSLISALYRGARARHRHRAVVRSRRRRGRPRAADRRLAARVLLVGLGLPHHPAARRPRPRDRAVGPALACGRGGLPGRSPRRCPVGAGHRAAWCS